MVSLAAAAITRLQQQRKHARKYTFAQLSCVWHVERQAHKAGAAQSRSCAKHEGKCRCRLSAAAAAITSSACTCNFQQVVLAHI
eukprot:16770-Heterococcus_DN1.PRE.2